MSDSAWQHPTGKAPESVVLVGLGPTKAQFCSFFTQHQPGIDLADPVVEVWAINTGIRFIRHDLAFVMDDLELFGDRFPAYGRALRAHDRPIITSREYPSFPAARAYPLAHVLNLVGPANDYFRNSVPYILAYALLIGVKRLALFGVDYDFPGARREHGRSNCEFWIGYLRARGVRVDVAEESTLLDQNQRHESTHWLYGYIRPPVITWENVPKPSRTSGTPSPIPAVNALQAAGEFLDAGDAPGADQACGPTGGRDTLPEIPRRTRP